MPESAALVFDLDNTLVHSRINFAAMRAGVFEILLAAGVVEAGTTHIAWPSVVDLIEIGKRHDAQQGTAIESDIWALVLEEERRGMELATVEDDAAQTLAALRGRGVPRAVLTNNARPATLAALKKFGLLNELDFVLARDDVPALKPAPDGLLLAQRCFGPSFRRLALVGDASIDGLAAQRAGLPFIAFRPRDGELEARGVEPWARIDSLAQVMELVDRLPAPR